VLFTDIRVFKAWRMIWSGHILGMGEIESTMTLVRKHEFKRLLGKSRHIWEDKIKSLLKK
jgi:hypothetical protein